MRLVRAIGVIALFTIAFAVLLATTDPQYQASTQTPSSDMTLRPGGFKKPILAMELVASMRMLKVFSTKPKVVEAIRHTMHLDFGYYRVMYLLRRSFCLRDANFASVYSLGDRTGSGQRELRCTENPGNRESPTLQL